MQMIAVCGCWIISYISVLLQAQSFGRLDNDIVLIVKGLPSGKPLFVFLHKQGQCRGDHNADSSTHCFFIRGKMIAVQRVKSCRFFPAAQPIEQDRKSVV